ncbi:MAG TPA: hypothetical protein VI894_02740 [Candidatus Nanoarchaeia archaeon]|nr:hypothetical protein [Candidatus Nanoarchaeia archaeon]
MRNEKINAKKEIKKIEQTRQKKESHLGKIILFILLLAVVFGVMYLLFKQVIRK